MLPSDFRTETWERLTEYLMVRIAQEREKNDHPLSDADTARIRGRLSAFKELLALQPADPASDASPE